MAVPFDHIATTYDSAFTRTAIGQLQRKHVWKYIENIIPQLDGLEMLELNMGSGEDALMFSDKGFNLIATDLSSEMLKITQEKAERFSMQSRVSSQYLDLDSMNEMLFDKKFDLIFSNFGGLNSISPEALKKLLERIPTMLTPKGRFIGIVMPKFCLWESLYYFAKLQFGKIFRRWTSAEVLGDFKNGGLRTWYYTPSQLKEWAEAHFDVVRTKPVGIALPPLCLDSFFLRKKKLLIALHKLEKKINQHSLYSGMSDHYIIDLQLRS